ncbi:MAG: MBOAT family O-acyltransferase, partial [Fusobacteriaceae bacterium]
YFPLGGSKVSKSKRYRNIMVVFLVSGLWHGASWNFIVWGGLHGIYQLIGIELKPFRDKIVRIFKVDRSTFSHKIYKIITTFILVDFAWIFFRANSFKDAKYIVKKLFVFNPWIFFDGTLYELGLDYKDFSLAILSIFFLIFVNILQRRQSIRKIVSEYKVSIRWILYYLIIFTIFIFGYYGDVIASQFIYFQF